MNHLSKVFGLFAFCFFMYTASCVYAQKDVFGLTQFHPTKPGTIEWNSEHWNNGIPRTFKYAPDPYDPTDWTEDHSASSPGFFIDGKGTMTMTGSPRFHINPERDSKVTPQLFTNIEFTAYYMKKGSDGKNWGGMVVGMRGHSFGHGSKEGDDCEALCYQARFRNDGKWDFEKELKHPKTTYYSGSGYKTQDPLWGGAKLPENRWIGMKYILTNINDDTQVRLRVYIDSTSNADPTNGGNWELVGEVIDDGTNWEGGDITGCSYTDPFMPILGGGNVYMRTDLDTAIYKMVSVREIDPTTGFGCQQLELGEDASLCGVDDITLNSNAQIDGISTFEWFKDGVSQGAPSTDENTITITEAGEWVVVIDSVGECYKKDTITVFDELPVVDLGAEQDLCNPSAITLDAGVTGMGISFVWSKDSKTLTETSNSLLVIDPGTYALTVSASNCVSQSGEVVITSSLPTQNHDTICSSGEVILSVTGLGTYSWYDAPADGNFLGDGLSITQAISSTATYYVQDNSVISNTVGSLTAPCAGDVVGAEATDMQFVAYEDFTLESVQVLQGNYGGTGEQDFIVEIWTDNGSDAPGKLFATGVVNTLTKPAAGTSQEATLLVNVGIEGTAKGTKYWLQLKSQATVYYDSKCTGAFPYMDVNTTGQIAQILQARHYGNSTTNYGTAYNWVISTGTFCLRTPVRGVVDPSHDDCSPVSVQSIDLKAGWNLVSLNVNPEDSSVPIIFPNAAVVKTLDVFFQRENEIFMNSLTEIEGGKGYLVYNKVDETITVEGTPVEMPHITSLLTGWNLIGVPTKGNFDVSNLPTEIEIVKDFETFYEKDNQLNSLDELKPGKGYFIKVNGNSSISW